MTRLFSSRTRAALVATPVMALGLTLVPGASPATAVSNDISVTSYTRDCKTIVTTKNKPGTRPSARLAINFNNPADRALKSKTEVFVAGRVDQTIDRTVPSMASRTVWLPAVATQGGHVLVVKTWLGGKRTSSVTISTSSLCRSLATGIASKGTKYAVTTRETCAVKPIPVLNGVLCVPVGHGKLTVRNLARKKVRLSHGVISCDNQTGRLAITAHKTLRSGQAWKIEYLMRQSPCSPGRAVWHRKAGTIAMKWRVGKEDAHWGNSVAP